MNNIPKKIHYCWFGRNPLPDDVKEYIESWKKCCQDYEIIEWNEDNFDINCNDYVKEAYQAKKWAFITDYVRLFVMYNYGGIYMDTDVEVLKSLDPFLKHHAFSGFESNNNIPTGIMASEKGFKLYKEFLDYYNDKHFINKDGSLDTTTNVVIMTNICKKYGLKQNNEYQEIEGWALYPSDYFCPKDYRDGTINLTDNTVVIHHFSGSWQSQETIKRKKIQQRLNKKYGNNTGKVLYNTIYLPYRIISEIKEHGIIGSIRFIKKHRNTK